MKTFTLLAKILNCRRQRQISPLPVYYILYNYILYCKVGGKANTCLRHQLSFSHCALSPEHPARKSCKILCIVDNTVDKIVVKIFVNIVVKIVVNIVVKIVVKMLSILLSLHHQAHFVCYFHTLHFPESIPPARKSCENHCITALGTVL